eukprot:CAMPEP_0194326586 /NCGR_PEP_ID=MMETSP0171-20130528/37178_1 /TAXON_ID=218684 /ORGANISM="Corethron pennatum, Strain L29A3" /LENGTH=72 /DNA_ID=CAMNT_0039086227 /DNA_START=546 /DNA_END=764 /DNA_ORIENTATION=-
MPPVLLEGGHDGPRVPRVSDINFLADPQSHRGRAAASPGVRDDGIEVHECVIQSLFRLFLRGLPTGNQEAVV